MPKGMRFLVDIFKALSDETRLRILALIWNDEMCVCEIEKSLNLTQSNASRHLTALKNAGLLLAYKRAQWIYYKLNDAFYQNNKALCEYLNVKFSTLPTYQGDIESMHKCKKEELCKTILNKE